MDERAGRYPSKRRSSTGSSVDKKRDAREANRIHCRQTRERNREKERLLKEVQMKETEKSFKRS